MADAVKIWSYEHDAWWRANSQGYTTVEARAGMYERAKAEEIVRSANYGGTLNEDKGVFLTEKAALLFIRANAHHLNEPRTYVKHFWRNSPMETVFRALEEFPARRWSGDEGRP